MTADIVDKKRLIFPVLAPLYEALSPVSYSFMRFATGAVLVPHGIQKIMLGSAVNLAPYIDKQVGLPNPLMWAYFAVFAESVCAVCLAIGFLTRVAALIILIEMVTIVFYFQSLPSNYELNKFNWLQEDGSRFCSGASLSS